MQILISLLKEANGTMPIKNIFAIYDPKTNATSYMPLNGLGKKKDVARGTGMCYFNGFFYGACLAKEHRVGSKLIIQDLKSKRTVLNDLKFSKAIHSITPLGICGPYNLILANSTQNDCISIITTMGTKVITEDLFFDFLTKNERMELDWKKEYEYDDLLHTNCVYQHNDNIYVSMFLDYQYPSKVESVKRWRKDTQKRSLGAIYNLTTKELVVEKCTQPHSIIINQFDELIYCESGSFSIINVNKNTGCLLKGFTRGLCEDKERGGYWVGLSYHRQFSTAINGAMVQFVSYNMDAEEPINLAHLGKEVYDIIEFKGI